jgi:hypothetical protein
VDCRSREWLLAMQLPAMQHPAATGLPWPESPTARYATPTADAPSTRVQGPSCCSGASRWRGSAACGVRALEGGLQAAPRGCGLRPSAPSSPLAPLYGTGSDINDAAAVDGAAGVGTSSGSACTSLMHRVPRHASPALRAKSRPAAQLMRGNITTERPFPNGSTTAFGRS